MASEMEMHTFDKPDEVRNFGHGRLELVQTGDGEIGRSTFEPGWRWSNDVKPIAKTDTCQVRHLGYTMSGTLHVQMDDGSEFDMTEGSVAMIPPGHDAWVIGNEPVVMIDWAGASNYAKPG